MGGGKVAAPCKSYAQYNHQALYLFGSYWQLLERGYAPIQQFTRSHQDRLALHPYGWGGEPLFGSPGPGCPGKISDFSF